MKKYLLGIDVGSSSVKASIVEAESGLCVASAFYPQHEAPIKSERNGWAEQSPNDWWTYLKHALAQVMSQGGVSGEMIAAVGISYQMHGLVCVDHKARPLRDAIIWCDSRAVPYGQRAFSQLGESVCLKHLLGSPGNFTASKLAWVKENEPDTYNRIWKIMLPGDYIALRLSGECNTTIGGLSEGMLWDFAENKPANFLLDFFGFEERLLPTVAPTFGIQSRISSEAAGELNLCAGTPITYRAGDQPNNALSLGVLNPGEVAATAGTSGVVYGVLGEVRYDPLSRVNTFAHVNHTATEPRLGVLLCINGTGILNAWVRRNIATAGIGYDEMNQLASQIPVGSDGISVIPFGNGAERVLQNNDTGCSFHGIQFSRHTSQHLMRATQEGIAFSFCYGMEVMQQMGMNISTIHAGHANMFLSPVFREALSTTSGACIRLIDSDGAAGAARGAGIGLGIYRNPDEAFASLRLLQVIEPNREKATQYADAYLRWKECLQAQIKQLT